MSRIALAMPVVGFDQPTVRIAAWLKAVGDPVGRGEPLAELETEKVTVTLESTASGTLVEIVAKPGEDVAVGEPVAWLEDGA